MSSWAVAPAGAPAVAAARSSSSATSTQSAVLTRKLYEDQSRFRSNISWTHKRIAWRRPDAAPHSPDWPGNGGLKGAARRSLDAAASTRWPRTGERYPGPARDHVRFVVIERHRRRRYYQRDRQRVWSASGRLDRLSRRFDALRRSGIALDAVDRSQRKDHARHVCSARAGRWFSGRRSVRQSG